MFKKTVCQDNGFTKGMIFFTFFDGRKKYYKCHHCQKDHLVKEGWLKKA